MVENYEYCTVLVHYLHSTYEMKQAVMDSYEVIVSSLLEYTVTVKHTMSNDLMPSKSTHSLGTIISARYQ